MDKGASAKRYPIEFTGSGGQFFRIWIVNILLTILTLYIYSAWAKVRTKRYFYGNTLLDGSSFEYHAKPLLILASRLVAAALFVAVTVGGSLVSWIPIAATVFLIVIIPWAIWRSTIFNMRMSSYRNVRFGFDGSVWPLYLYQALLPTMAYFGGAKLIYLAFDMNLGGRLIGVLVVAVLLVNVLVAAYSHGKLSSYFLNHYRYGKSRFSGELTQGMFFKTYFMALLVAIAILAAVVVPAMVYLWFTGGSFIDVAYDTMSALDPQSTMDDEYRAAAVWNIVKVTLFFYAYVLLVGYLAVAIIRARVRNHVFSQAALDGRVQFESTVRVIGLWWVMLSNALLLILTLGLAFPYTDELGDAFDMNMDVSF